MSFRQKLSGNDSLNDASKNVTVQKVKNMFSRNIIYSSYCKFFDRSHNNADLRI